MGSIGKPSRNHHQLSVVYVQCNCVQLYTHHQLIMSHNYQQTGWLACPGWVGNRTALQNRSAKVMFERLLVTQCNVTGNFSYQVTSGPEQKSEKLLINC